MACSLDDAARDRMYTMQYRVLVFMRMTFPVENML